MVASSKPNEPAQQKGFVYLPLIAGWLIPGAGHFLVGKWGRGALIAISIVAMFVLGLAMQGKLYTEIHDVFDLLGLIADLGNGLLYWMARGAGLGAQMVERTTADYGKIFLCVSGLLNVISAVDAHNLRTGRKPL
jgi:TM2 domain-containing membrane protein YozV